MHRRRRKTIPQGGQRSPHADVKFGNVHSGSPERTMEIDCEGDDRGHSFVAELWYYLA
jgi:hypothetical protein